MKASLWTLAKSFNYLIISCKTPTNNTGRFKERYGQDLTERDQMLL